MDKYIERQITAVKAVAEVAGSLESGTTFTMGGTDYIAINKEVTIAFPSDLGDFNEYETYHASHMDLSHSENWVYAPDGKTISHGGAITTKPLGNEEFNEMIWDMSNIPNTPLGEIFNEFVNNNLAKLYTEYHNKHMGEWEFAKYMHTRNR